MLLFGKCIGMVFSKSGDNLVLLSAGLLHWVSKWSGEEDKIHPGYRHFQESTSRGTLPKHLDVDTGAHNLLCCQDS